MKKLFLLSLLIFVLIGCNSVEPITKEKTYLGYLTDDQNHLVPLLNTEVYMTTVKPSLKEDMTSQAQESLFRYHMLLDAYHDFYTDEKIINIKYLNEHFNKGPIKISDELFDCLKKAIEYSKLTEGYFNPTIGKLVDVYDGKFLPYQSVNDDPDKNEIIKALDTVVDYQELENYIVLDDNNKTVELLPYNGYQYYLNLGAMAKGYALNNIKIDIDSSYLITAGSSSILTYVKQGEYVTWNVGCKQVDSNELLFIFNLANDGISTSGDDENYYLLKDGTRRHHILNPYTGFSENYYRSISLISEDVSVIDALSTALFNISDMNKIHEIINDVENMYQTKIGYCFVKEVSDNRFELIVNEYFNSKIDNDNLSKNIERVIVE